MKVRCSKCFGSNVKLLNVEHQGRAVNFGLTVVGVVMFFLMWTMPTKIGFTAVGIFGGCLMIYANRVRKSYKCEDCGAIVVEVGLERNVGDMDAKDRESKNGIEMETERRRGD